MAYTLPRGTEPLPFEHTELILQEVSTTSHLKLSHELKSFLPKHGKDLARSLRVGSPFIAVEFYGDVLEAAVAIGAVELAHLKLIVSTRPCGSRFYSPANSNHGIAVFVPVQHLGVTVHETAIARVLVDGQWMPRQLLLLLLLMMVMHLMSCRWADGSVHAEFLAGCLHMSGGLDDHVLGRHLVHGSHVLGSAMLLRKPLTAIHVAGIRKARLVHVWLRADAVDGSCGCAGERTFPPPRGAMGSGIIWSAQVRTNEFR